MESHSRLGLLANPIRVVVVVVVARGRDLYSGLYESSYARHDATPGAVRSALTSGTRCLLFAVRCESSRLNDVGMLGVGTAADIGAASHI